MANRPRPGPWGCALVAFCFVAGGLSIVGAITVSRAAAHWLLDRLVPELRSADHG